MAEFVRSELRLQIVDRDRRGLQLRLFLVQRGMNRVGLLALSGDAALDGRGRSERRKQSENEQRCKCRAANALHLRLLSFT